MVRTRGQPTQQQKKQQILLQQQQNPRSKKLSAEKDKRGKELI